MPVAINVNKKKCLGRNYTNSGVKAGKERYKKLKTLVKRAFYNFV